MTTQATKAAERRERPILFSGPMVRAILGGRKTQTRRVINPQPSESWTNNANTNWAEYYKQDRWGHLQKHLWIMHPTKNKEIVCPYGKPGDRLWVRETMYISDCGQFYARHYGASVAECDVLATNGSQVWYHNRYEPKGFDDKDRRFTHNEFAHMTTGWSNLGTKRGFTQFEQGFADVRTDIPIKPFTGNTIIQSYSARFTKRKSGIFMPRWASRIILEIINIRVERLQAIALNDCYEEGIERPRGPKLGSDRIETDNARSEFHSGWDKLNAKRGYSWESNPWVWVITFKRVNVPERETETRRRDG